jgi:hypothetical protein
MIAADPRSQMLSEMGECAYRLGKVFGAEAERAETHERRVEFFQLFDRCFFAVRMSVALELRLRRLARTEAAGRDAGGSAERDRIERDPAETDTETYIERETEGDRERERASLPVLLSNLNSIVADASALPGPPPAALPTLRELLARVKTDPAPGARPPGGVRLRARLAGSATTPVSTSGALALASPPPPHPSGRRGAQPLRRATGPPR